MKAPRPFLTIACVLALGAVTAWANSVSTPNIPVVGPVLNGDLLLGTRSGVTYNMSWPPASALNASTFLGSTTTSNPSLSNDLTTGLYTSAPGQVGVVITTTPKASWTASRTYDYNPVTINLNTGALASTLTGSVLQLGNANATPTRIESDVYGSSSYLSSVRLDGNATSPTAILSGDEIGGVNAWGYNGAAVAGPQASVREYAAANWTTTSTPTYVDIAATPTNSTTMAEVARFYGDGGVALPSTVTGGDEGAGTLNAAGLYVNGVAVGTGSGTVTSVSVATANGFSGTVANATTTPAITIIAGAINPTSVGATTSGAVTATTVTAANAAISGTTTMGNDVVTGTTALKGTTTISGLFNATATANMSNVIITGGSVDGTTLGASTSSTAIVSTVTAGSLVDNGAAVLKGTTTISGALVDTATISLTGIVAGTVSGNQFLGVNSSGNVIYSASGSTNPATPAQSFQYDNGGSFGGATGLYYSTTRSGLDFLANVTTANLLSLGDNGADTTSYALGESALLAQSTTNRDNTAIGGFSLTAVTTGTSNTALGWDSGQVITTGKNNTIIGALVASTTLTTGTNNILIGVDNTVDTAATNTTSTLNIGNLLGGVLTNATHNSQYPLTLTATGSGVQGFVMQNTPTGQAPILTVAGSDTNGTGLGIAINALTATATGVGGGVALSAGTGFGNGVGGAVTMSGGTGGTAGNGGAVNITGGSSLNAAAGSVTIQGGTGNASSTSGGVTIEAGAENAGNVGAVLITQPNQGNSFKTIGNINITGGAATATNVTGGAVIVTGGSANTSGSSNTGGAAQLIAGAGGPAGGSGGTITITSGAGGTTTGVPGAININLGATTSSAGGTLPFINMNGPLNFTTTQAAFSNLTGVHSTTAGALALSTTGTDRVTISSAGLVTMSSGLNVTSTIQQGIELSCSTGLTTDGSGNINGCVASDAILKTNIQPLVYDATLIDRLQPVSYAWREPGRYDDKKHGGFIAQQVQIVDPLAVKSAGKDLLGLDNSALAADIVLDLQSVHRQLATDHGAFPFHKCFFDLLVCAD